MNNNTVNIKKLDSDHMAIIKNCEKDFIHLIRDRLGIITKNHQIADMHKTILNACHQFNCTPQEYLSILQTCRDDTPQLEYLVTGITIGETYFFRDAHQIQLLQETVLPALIKSKRDQNNLSLRIWSAGCATGEEIYTIAMMLIEMLPDIKKWTLQLLGTDINTASLRKAIAASYNEWSMRSIKADYKNNYFSLDGNKYNLKPHIKELVSFSYLNLNDDNYPSVFNNTNAQDLILCRNVLIYFDSDRIEKLMKKLNACLIDGAFLLLGASDPINIKNTNLSSYHREGALLIRNSSMIEDKIKNKPSESIIQQPVISKATLKVCQMSAKKASQATPNESTQKRNSDLNRPALNKLVDDGSWEDIINMINTFSHDAMDTILLNSKATALANLGRLEEAVKTCHESLSLDATNASTYFTMAMILAEENHAKEAEDALRKSLFLDHQFVAAHFQLGLLLIKNKQLSNGLKSLHNALTIALANNPSQNVEGFKGFDYGRLAEILKREIELYANSEKINKS